MSKTPTSVLWEVTARLVLLSDTHIGPAAPDHRRADETGSVLPVDRAPDTGLPRLRATTLAGLLRHDLTARTGDTGAAATLFGTAATEDPDGIGHPGALDLDDAEGQVPGSVVSRAGNRVDPASGTALPGHLWSREILPAGTVLTVHLRLHVSEPEDEGWLLGLLAEAVAGLHGPGPEHTWPPGSGGTQAHAWASGPAPASGPEHGPGSASGRAQAHAPAPAPGPGLHVGARTGRGHGAVTATTWGARRYDLTTAEDWFAYHARTWEQRHEDGEHTLADGPGTLAETLSRALRTGGPPDLARDLPAGPMDRRHRDELRLTLAVGESEQPLAPGRVRPGLLMIADLPPPDRVGTVDRVHRRRPVARPAARCEGTTAGHRGPCSALSDTESEGTEAHGTAPAQNENAAHGSWDAPERATPCGDTPEDEGITPAVPDPAPSRSWSREADRAAPVPEEPEDPPATFRSTPELPEPEPVLGDTALHALLKRIAARLARDACEALGGDQDLWRDWHAHWWGGDTDPATALPRPSRVRLRRTPVLTGGAPLTTTRLTVDSLFGDAVDGHLSTSDVHCGGTAETVLDVHEPDDTVRGLLALLVRELATVPADTLGSGAGSGHGRVTATAATLTLHTDHDGPARTVDLLTAVRDPDSVDARTARAWVSRWHARLCPPPVGEGER